MLAMMSVAAMRSLIFVCFAVQCYFCYVYGSTLKPTSLKLGGRLVNGQLAPPGSFPYQVSLMLEGVHFCGGSIINRRWILTSAYCVYGKEDKVENVTVLAGTVTLDEGGDKYQAETIVRHPDFGTPLQLNDIALVKVAESIEYNEYVNFVYLPSSFIERYSYPAVVSGWGKTEAGWNTPDPVNELHYLNTTMLSDEECTYTHTNHNEQKICVLNDYYGVGHQGICFSDYGSPLVADGIQEGIVSYFLGNCAITSIDIYTRVWSHLEWIEKYTTYNGS